LLAVVDDWRTSANRGVVPINVFFRIAHENHAVLKNERLRGRLVLVVAFPPKRDNGGLWYSRA